MPRIDELVSRAMDEGEAPIGRRAVIALAKRCLVLSDVDARRVPTGQMAVAPRRCAATVRELKQFLCNEAE